MNAVVYIVLTPWGEVCTEGGVPAASWHWDDAIYLMRRIATVEYELDMLDGGEYLTEGKGWYMPARECWLHGYRLCKARLSW